MSINVRNVCPAFPVSEIKFIFPRPRSFLRLERDWQERDAQVESLLKLRAQLNAPTK